jgi:hypothetical protein
MNHTGKKRDERDSALGAIITLASFLSPSAQLHSTRVQHDTHLLANKTEVVYR